MTSHEATAAYATVKHIIDYLERLNVHGRFRGRLISQQFERLNHSDEIDLDELQKLVKISHLQYLVELYQVFIEDCAIPREERLFESVLALQVNLMRWRRIEQLNNFQELQSLEQRYTIQVAAYSAQEFTSNTEQTLGSQLLEQRIAEYNLGQFKKQCKQEVRFAEEGLQGGPIQWERLTLEENKEVFNDLPRQRSNEIPSQFPLANLFAQDTLDRLLVIFNERFSDFKPRLNADNQSKLSDFISKQGWHLSLSEINNKYADYQRKIVFSKFEGAIRKSGWFALQDGLYYGQQLDGKRDGYGILYCISSREIPCLFECEWKENLPVQGRYIWVRNGQLAQYQGQIDDSYTQTGYGVEKRSKGHCFEGEFYQGQYNGKGRLIQTNKTVIEGTWELGKLEGVAKTVLPDGSYWEGQWEEDQRVGMHQLYGKEGEVLSTEEHTKIEQSM
ncbi:hypothetical protein FGO68_gene16369 [Halteria grandinella]|uniref:MORN repeat protein n=1 Tax=Halteria grandinella TaxID=5974 RepID=A0A8J8NMV8_HALGN|nr:hypothetical protein FGO68_gene16369 [Halteria grandinella]